MDIKTIAIFSSLMLTASTYACQIQPSSTHDDSDNNGIDELDLSYMANLYSHMTSDKVRKVLAHPMKVDGLVPGFAEFSFTRVFDFSNDLSLTELPDEKMLFQAIDLRELNLSGCKNLKKLPENIGMITSCDFQELNLRNCTSLTRLPDSLKSLAYNEGYTLNIVGCTGLIRDEQFNQLIRDLKKRYVRVIESNKDLSRQELEMEMSEGWSPTPDELQEMIRLFAVVPPSPNLSTSSLSEDN